MSGLQAPETTTLTEQTGTPAHVVDFAQITLDDVARVGGKKAALGKLFRTPRPKGVGVLFFYLLVIPISVLSSAQSAISSLPAPPPPIARGEFWRWLWDLGGSTDLLQTTVIAIAALAAFLTVVEVWQIPAATASFSPAAPAKGGARGGENATEAQVQSPNDRKGDKPASLLQSNFTTTVLSGLGGLAVVSLLDSLQASRADGNNVKAYYVVLFVLFFSIFLFGSAVLRGLGEALRSRVAIPYDIPLPRAWEKSDGENTEEHLPEWLSYRFRRFWRWLLSYRTTILVLLDTSFNVVQGKNQLQSAVFSEKIVELQRSLVRTVDQVRESLAEEILHAIKGLNEVEEEHPSAEDVRVNISILSADGSSVYYVSRDPKSLPRPFGRHSIAWLSIVAGVARWCKMDDDGKLSYYPETLLIGDQDQGLLPDSGPHLLTNYFEYRPEPDYKAFIVLPIPWLARGEEGQYRRAGIQISFAEREYMDAIWGGLEHRTKVNGHRMELIPSYKQWEDLLDLPAHKGAFKEEKTNDGTIFIKDPGFHAALHQAVKVLEEALRHFNDTIFEEVIRPERQL